ncbi:pyridoxal-phosphate dependent enzyme [Candidatus Amarolinea aalborgensis]|uniref:pyridoxal-phosphate dependent enzyme n=1 Tax=Candidatus Amarolinea aalborgensis TaxID=2249329 RepID=UPI003BF9A381
MPIPTLLDILAAQRRLRPYLPRTPMHNYPALDALIGAAVYVKHENYQPIGAFKVRGGINLMAHRAQPNARPGSSPVHGQPRAVEWRMPRDCSA